jgi:hypothetical protein
LCISTPKYEDNQGIPRFTRSLNSVRFGILTTKQYEMGWNILDESQHYLPKSFPVEKNDEAEVNNSNL